MWARLWFHHVWRLHTRESWVWSLERASTRQHHGTGLWQVGVHVNLGPESCQREEHKPIILSYNKTTFNHPQKKMMTSHKSDHSCQYLNGGMELNISWDWETGRPPRSPNWAWAWRDVCKEMGICWAAAAWTDEDIKHYVNLFNKHSHAQVCLSSYLWIGLLLGHSGRHKAWLTLKDVAIHIQRGDRTTYRKWQEPKWFWLNSPKLSLYIKKRKKTIILPCMDMEGATDATGIGGMETPKEL